MVTPEHATIGPMPDIDWKHVAVAVARADGAFYGLTTPERDALEQAMSDAPAPDSMMGVRDAEELLEARGIKPKSELRIEGHTYRLVSER